MRLHTPTATLALAAALAQAFNITFYSDTDFKTPIAKREITAQDGCRTDFARQAYSVRVRGDVELDDDTQLQVRFYSSGDCSSPCERPRVLAGLHTGRLSLAAWHKGYMSRVRAWFGVERSVLGSYDVVRPDRFGRVEADGYCGVRHGQVVEMRGRSWRWWQVGSFYYVEVPVEEWDDAVHVPDTESRVKRHGYVEQDGKLKWWQIQADMFKGVPVEEWDDEVHVKNEEPFVWDTDLAGETSAPTVSVVWSELRPGTYEREEEIQQESKKPGKDEL